MKKFFMLFTLLFVLCSVSFGQWSFNGTNPTLTNNAKAYHLKGVVDTVTSSTTKLISVPMNFWELGNCTGYYAFKVSGTGTAHITAQLMGSPVALNSGGDTVVATLLSNVTTGTYTDTLAINLNLYPYWYVILNGVTSNRKNITVDGYIYAIKRDN